MKLLINAITAQGWPGRASLGVSVALLMTLILDFALIPSYGDIGASIASSVAYPAGGIALVFIAVRLLGCAPRDFLPRPREALLLVLDDRARPPDSARDDDRRHGAEWVDISMARRFSPAGIASTL